MQVAMLGLGEAGARLAADLEQAGCTVLGWDPARPSSAGSAAAAVHGADVVLSVNAASVALDVAAEVRDHLLAGALYADLNTAAPELKERLAGLVPVDFADVALVGVVPSTGLATPALASGGGAERFASLFRPLGMPVDVVANAAGLKLLRSVFMKGVAVAAIEALEAARAAGAEEHVRADIAGVIGEPLLDRFVEGSRAHAGRRIEEMRAAAAYLEELGVPPHVATAAREWLQRYADEAVGLERGE